MFSTVISGALLGMESYLTCVEVDVSNGLPGFEMVGLLSAEVKEARERVKIALKNSGFVSPPRKITVNLAPANIRKNGTAFDLPIALGILVAENILQMDQLEKIMFVGELGLNGEVKFVPGVLPMVLEARKQGISKCILPLENAREGAVVDGIDVIGVESLEETVEYLRRDDSLREAFLPPTKVNIRELFNRDSKTKSPDFSEVSGQEVLKRAVEIAASGFHHLMMIGPPGSGKTMIAKRIPSVLPPLSLEESLEISKIYSISGRLHAKESLITKRPFYSPHHTISEQALAGGGKVPHPGIISLSHRGVLFLDEAVHFSNAALETLRQPMEDKKVQISRSYGTFTFPADFMLVAAMNPCPCGYYPDRNRCNCTYDQVKKYVSRISGPIADRIDIRVEAPRAMISELENKTKGESSADMRKRIEVARAIQKDRYRKTPYQFNAELSPQDIRRYCELGTSEKRLLEHAYEKMDLSARSYHKVLRVARTIADLNHSDRIREEHLSEAICYRTNRNPEEN